MTNKVSVIIPVYNVERYLERCITSVINQTYKNIEIILVNDGSTDGSLQICNQYAQNDNRIKVISKENQGLGLARNTGLENANGDYVIFIDSDDYVDTNLIEDVLDLMHRNNCEMVRFHHYRENINTGEFYVRKSSLNEGEYNKKEIIEKMLMPIVGKLPNESSENFVSMSAWSNMYKMSVIKSNGLKFESERIYIAEDLMFNIYYFSKIERAYVTNKPYYHYMVNDNSLTTKYNPNRFTKNVEMVNEVKARLKTMGYTNDYEIRLSRRLIDSARNAITAEFRRKNVKYSIKNDNIKGILNNVELKKAMGNYPISKMQMKYRLVLYFMKHKMYCFLYVIFKFFKKI